MAAFRGSCLVVKWHWFCHANLHNGNGSVFPSPAAAAAAAAFAAQHSRAVLPLHSDSKSWHWFIVHISPSESVFSQMIKNKEVRNMIHVSNSRPSRNFFPRYDLMTRVTWWYSGCLSFTWSWWAEVGPWRDVTPKQRKTWRRRRKLRLLVNYCHRDRKETEQDTENPFDQGLEAGTSGRDGPWTGLDCPSSTSSATNNSAALVFLKGHQLVIFCL